MRKAAKHGQAEICNCIVPNLTFPAYRQRRRRRPAHQKVHYLAMENDQVRCISCTRIGARGSDYWLEFFQGILVDLYVPRKCAATSEFTYNPNEAERL